MKKQNIIARVLVIVMAMALTLGLVACQPVQPSKPEQPELQVTGYENPVEVNQDDELTDAMLLEGVVATYGDETYTVYVVDKSAVNTANLGETKVVLGVKDTQGEVVKDDDGADVVYERTVRVVEVYYADVTISGNGPLEFDLNAEITDEMLLDGVSAGEGFTVYVKDSSALDATEVGDYEVTLGVKKGDRIVKSAPNTEVTATRVVSILEPEKVLTITFYYNDEPEIAPAYIEVGSELTENQIAAIVLNGISAKDDDFFEYLVKITDMSALNVNESGTYEVVLGAFNGTDAILDAEGNPFTATREVIVKQFEKLAAPANLVVGTGNDVGKIKFSAVANAESYVAKIMRLEDAADAEPVLEVELAKNVLEIGYISLDSGDYTVMVKAQGEGFNDSDYSESLKITYTLFEEFLAEDIAKFDNIDHGEPALEGDLAKITATIDGWGKARSGEFTINYALNPVLALDIAKADNSHFATLVINGREIAITGDTKGGNPLMKALPNGGYAGRQYVHLVLGPTGGGPSVWYRAARVFALAEYEEPVYGLELPNPTDLAVANSGDSISWKGHDQCEEYKVVIYKRGTEEVVEEASTGMLSYKVAHLEAGNYTFTVQAMGKEPLTVSSGVASWDFMIKEYANWSAEDIAQFNGVGFEAETNVGLDNESGLAVINLNGMREFGAVAVAAEKAPTVNLANRPIVVMHNTTITGGWLARSVFNDTIINVMKNDTYENKTYDALTMALWQNVDGGLVNGAGGSVNNPAGVGTYRFFMGFCGGKGSSIAIERMRIVYVEEFYEGYKPLVQPTAFAKSSFGDGLTFTSNGAKYEYEIYRYTANEAYETGSVSEPFVSVAHLPAGNYRLAVRALGSEAEGTANSDWGEHYFTIKDVVSYTAQDMQNFVTMGDGTVAYDAETGMLTITSTGEGDFYIAALAKDDMSNHTNSFFTGSSRTVVVVDGLTVVNGSWLAKMHGRGQGTGADYKFESNMHNADGNSYAHYVQSAWLDHENFRLDMFTEWAGGPGGHVYEYYYVLGVTAGSSIQVKGLKLAQVTDLFVGDVVINGELTAVSGDVGATFTDEAILAGLSASFGADQYTLYVADRSALDNATGAGEYKVLIGVKDLGGNVVEKDGVAVVVERSVIMVSSFYENVEFAGADQITIEQGEVLTDEDLLAGVTVSDGTKTYTAYVADKSALNVANEGTYTVVIGAKDGDQVLMQNIETAWVVTRTIVVTHKTVVEFAGANDIVVGLNAELTAEEITALVLAGVTATEVSNGAYEVRIKEAVTVDLACAATYVFVLGAYDAEGNLAQNKTETFTIERKFIVSESEYVAAPAGFAIANGAIKFNAAAQAEAYEYLIVALGGDVNAEAVVSGDITTPSIAFDKINLANGTYTLFVKAYANHFKASAYSEGYSFTYTDVVKYDANAIAQFAGAEHAEAKLEGNVAKIQPTADGWGRVTSEEITADFNKAPMIAVDFEEVSVYYFLNLNIDGGYKYLTGDTIGSKDILMPLKSFQVAEYTGVQTFNLILGVSGGDSAYVTLNSVKIFYLAEYVAPPAEKEELEDPAGFAPGLDGASIAWNYNDKVSGYAVSVKTLEGETVVIEETVLSDSRLQVAQLAAGNYTLVVKALGDGEVYTDSGVVTYNFTITDYANWNAQQIGATFTGEGWEATSKVQYNEELGQAVINYDGSRDYGAVGNPVEGAPIIDLSRRPVVLFTNVDITTGWLARGFFDNSSIYAMRNDTYVTGTVHHDTLIFRTWTNVDGNLVPGAGGSVNAPTGTGAYRFLMGFVGGSSSRVAVGGMRIVTVSEYVAPPVEKLPLDAPSGFAINNGSIKFNAVANAEEYEYVIVALGGDATAQAVASATTVPTTINLNALNLASGNYTLFVKAHAEGYESSAYSEGYNFTYTEVANYNAEAIAQFTSLFHAQATLDGAVAKVNPVDGNGWGGVKGGDLVANFSKQLMIAIDFESVSNAYFLGVYVGGGNKNYRGDTTGATDVLLALKAGEASNLEGVQTFNLVLGVTGGADAFVTYNSIKVFFVEEYVVPPAEKEELAAPEGFATDLDGASIKWNYNDKVSGYTVSVKTLEGETVAIAETSILTSKIQVAHLAAGNYTLLVKAVGDGVTYSDSEVASYNFTITDYANWNAQQIGTTFTGEGWEATSTVMYDEASGKAIINHDGSRGYGAVGNPVEGAPVIDLSRLPVVILTDIDITTGWLARAFFGNSSIIVTQNDTVVEGTKHYDNLIFRTWTNVDGNLVPGAGGTKNAPTGTGAYRFLMGFTISNTSRVALGGMRIVTVGAYVDPSDLPMANVATNFKANASDITWETNTTKYQYELRVKDSEEVLESGNGEGTAFNAAVLSAGAYTLRVKALGDGTFTSDADAWGEFNFTVKDVYNYTAADIATFVKIEGDGTITYDEANNKVSITASEAGALFIGYCLPTDLASGSSKFKGSECPVIVISGLNVVSGKWCARVYGRGQASNYNTQMATLHNDDATSFDTYTHKAWLNSDGNHIGTIFSGDANAPGGWVRDYLFALGITAGSTVEITSLRIVTIA